MRILLSCLFVTVLLASHAAAQEIPPQLRWINTDEAGYLVAVGPDGGPVLVRYSQVDGSVRVTKLHPDTGAQVWSTASQLDGEVLGVQALAVGVDGHPVALARRNSDGAAVLLKLDGATGAVLWSYEGVECNAVFGMEIEPTGAVIGLLRVAPDAQGRDMLALALDGATGALAWSTRLGADDWVYPRALAIGPGGRVVVTGTAGTLGGFDFYTAVLDADTGTLLWTVVPAFAGEDMEAEAYDVAIDPAGNPVVCGYAIDPNDYEYYVRVVKYDGATGAMLWSAEPEIGPGGGRLVGEGMALAIGADGRVFVGATYESAEYFKFCLDGATGAPLWYFAGMEDDSDPVEIAVGEDGHPVMLSQGNGATYKLDADTGAIRWMIVPSLGYPTSVLDPTGAIVAMYTPYLGGGGSTVRYSGPDPSIQWVRAIASRYPNIACGPDGHPVAADVLVQATETGNVRRARVRKLDRQDGSLRWNRELGSDAVGGICGLTATEDGDVFVAATDPGPDTSLFRLGGQAGDLLWGITLAGYHGPVATAGDALFLGGPSVLALETADGQSRWEVTLPAWAQVVATGPDGHPVVATSSPPIVTKLDAASGATLWQEDLSAIPGFWIHALAVGPDGHVVAVGEGNLPGWRYGPHAVKLDGSTGAPLWSIALDEPLIAPYEDHYGTQVAIGRDGDPILGIVVNGEVEALARLRLDGATGAAVSVDLFGTGTYTGNCVVAAGAGGALLLGGTAQYYSVDGSGYEDRLWIVAYRAEAPTPEGDDVAADLDGGTALVDGVTLTFATVSKSGESLLSTRDSGPALPSGFTLGDPAVFYDLQTTAGFEGLITVAIQYDPARFQDPANARLLHFEGGTWLDVTTANDEVNHVVTGVVTSLSPFVVVESAANAPPVADPSATLGEAISANNVDALVLLDGSRSSDADEDALTFVWLLDEVTIATGETALVALPIGAHSIDLDVSDGQATTRASLSVHVVSLGDATRTLSARVDVAAMHDLHHGIAKALRAKLRAAAAAFDHGDFGAGVNSLEAFQNQLAAQRGKKVEEALADELSAGAQRIIDAVEGG